MILTSGILILSTFLAVAVTAGWTAGDQVVLTGRVARIPAQHLVDASRAADVVYLDVDGGGQIVAYARGGIRSGGRIRITGTVVRTAGGSKRPGSAERYTELQLDVRTWEELGRPGTAALLDRLASRDPGREEKAGVESEIASSGKEAVPVLLAHLHDARVCWTERTLVNEGELLNRPPGSPPVAERWIEKPVTVGERADELLHRIVSPLEYSSPFARNVKPFQVGPGVRPFRVVDWPAFWEERKARTLSSIQEEMKRHVDAYWKAHGVEQEVR